MPACTSLGTSRSAQMLLIRLGTGPLGSPSTNSLTSQPLTASSSRAWRCLRLLAGLGVAGRLCGPTARTMEGHEVTLLGHVMKLLGAVRTCRAEPSSDMWGL